MSVQTKQQMEALNYFKAHADEWRSKAKGAENNQVNIVQQRNNYALEVASEHPSLKSFLDVGCGTGELVCDMAKRGINAVGVDYAQEMIDLAFEKAQKEYIQPVTFTCCSIFDFEMSTEDYDFVSANGFIEYISPNELSVFFDLVAGALAPGGSFVVGSRNRLFNLFSMNDFTLRELQGRDLELLIQEAVMWTTRNDFSDVLSCACAALQLPYTKHKNTGVNVSTRYQYTPLQLIKSLHEKGLSIAEVYPIHIHAMTPVFGSVHPEIHEPIATMLQSYARHSKGLLPNSSSFMLHVKKSN